MDTDRQLGKYKENGTILVSVIGSSQYIPAVCSLLSVFVGVGLQVLGYR